MAGIIKMLRDNVIAHRITTSLVCLFQLWLYVCFFMCHSVVKPVVQRRMKKISNVTVISVNDMDSEEGTKKMKSWDVVVKNEGYYAKMAAYRTLGLGETYMDGWWDAEDLEEHFYRVLSTDLQHEILDFPRFTFFLDHLKYLTFNLQTPTKSWEVGRKHYDLSNELYEKMLDKTMTYTCGYWKNAKTLEEAQINKMELIAQKLKLKPGMKVLELGCGWGGLCEYLARKYKVRMVGCTIGVEGANYGRKRCHGLPVEILTCDYRDIKGKFDRVVSVGMFEHVGHRNYDSFFEHSRRCLRDDGIMLLHTIGVNDKKVPIVDGWINTYIFPGGSLPYPENICKASDGKFIIEDWHNMGYNYHYTLKAWCENFEKNWPSLKQNYEEPEKFYRMWTYYLKLSSAMFRSRKMQLWQVVFSKNGLAGGYDAPR